MLLLLSVSICIKNSITTFLTKNINYKYNFFQTLGELMCSIIPTCQILGVTATSVSLVAIALDRYRNVVYALSKRWNPGLFYCLLGTAIGWLACAGKCSQFRKTKHQIVFKLYLQVSLLQCGFYMITEHLM